MNVTGTSHDAQLLDDLAARAASACERHDLASAMELWAHYRTLRPTDSLGYLQAGIALRAALRYDEADAVLALGLALAADRFEIAVQHAWVAHQRDDWESALARWHAVAQDFPAAQEGHTGIGFVFLKTQRLDEAESQLALVRVLFPTSEYAATLFSEVAMARGDYRTALVRLDAALALNPTGDHLKTLRGVALWHIGMESGVASGVRAVVTENPDKSDVTPLRSLFMQFESLGENCEFGLVQRRFGAEPLGLLRWTHTRPETLIHLLNSNFSGLGEDGNVRIKHPDAHEYYIEDTVYGIVFHTFTSQYKDSESEFLASQSRRLRWLRDKMLADLSEGAKTFVYKFHDSDSSVHLQPLVHALSRYGGCRLLCISQADQDNLAASVRTDGSGLFFAYLSRLSPTAVPNTEWDIPFGEWISICRQVDAMCPSLSVPPHPRT